MLAVLKVGYSKSFRWGYTSKGKIKYVKTLLGKKHFVNSARKIFTPTDRSLMKSANVSHSPTLRAPWATPSAPIRNAVRANQRLCSRQSETAFLVEPMLRWHRATPQLRRYFCADLANLSISTDIQTDKTSLLYAKENTELIPFLSRAKWSTWRKKIT